MSKQLSPVIRPRTTGPVLIVGAVVGVVATLGGTLPAVAIYLTCTALTCVLFHADEIRKPNKVVVRKDEAWLYALFVLIAGLLWFLSLPMRALGNRHAY